MEKIVRDVKGQDCPIPLITLKDALKDAEPGHARKPLTRFLTIVMNTSLRSCLSTDKLIVRGK